MATDMQTRPAAKYEVFVDQQLAKVRQRIRALDAGRSLLMLGVVSLGYFLLMAAFDLWAGGADTAVITGVRLGLFGIYLLVMGYFVAQLCLRLYRRINPYYAAKQLEETIPDAKNSVINWLDLRGEELPGAIRSAVGLKAAHDLKHTDADKAVDPKSNWLLGGILAGLLLGIFILFAMGPHQFGSLLGRAFAPFRDLRMDSRAQITLLRPAEGNATISLNQRVEFQAQIEGRFPAINQPGAPRVLYRYQQSDPFVVLPLEEAIDRTWSASLAPDQVRSGFWYKVAAGDAETEEYQVKVQSLPQANRFEVTYRYRPYRKLDPHKVQFPNDKAIFPRILESRGTDVTLLVHTNRQLGEASVHIETGGDTQRHPAEILADDPQALRFKFTLERSGSFRVLFKSRDGEENIDRAAYVLEVLDDSSPHVILTSPGKDISLPANGTLALEGAAQDDFGIKGLSLRMKVLEGDKRPLAPKAFPEGKSLEFEDGTYPDKLDYLDVVALEKLQTTEGKPFPLKAGMILEYWLEATDNSDFPNKTGNVGKSEAFKLTIQDPTKDDKKQKEERQRAEEKKKQHDKQQEEKLKQENKDRNEQKKEASKSEAEKKKDEQKKNDDQQKLKQDAEKIKDQLDKQQKDKEKGEAKPEDPAKGEKKPGDSADQKPAENKDQKPGNPDDAGQKKEDGKEGDKAGAAKDQGPKDKGADNKPGDAKGPGEQKPPQEGAKGNDTKKDQGDKGETKGGPGKEQQGQAKDKGDAGNNPQPGAPKDGKQAEPAPAQAKGGDPDAPKGEMKPGGDNQQAAGKANGQKGQGGAGDSKEASPEQMKDSGTAKDDKGRPNGQPKEPNARDVADLEKELRRKEQAKEALEELERIAKEAKDEKVRDAAREAIERVAKETPPGAQDKGDKGPDTQAKATPKDGGEPGMGDPPADAGKTKTGDPKGEDCKGKGDGAGKDPQLGKSEAKPGNRPGNFGPGGKGITDDIKPQDPIAEFARSGGELQLDDLRKRVTPDMLKEMSWTDGDWKSFLQRAEKYNESIRRDRKLATTNPNKKGGTSLLPSTRPELIEFNPSGVSDPLNTNRAQPPPEFREAVRQFTTKQK